MTIKDIARECGFSVSTVSRALNNHPDISQATKERVQQVVQSHGFVPNTNARQLKVQQSRSVLIIVKGAFNVFFADILERMQTAIADADYSAEVHYIDEDADEVYIGAQLQRERKPLGMIFLGGNVHVFQKSFGAIDIPSVLATTVSAEMQFTNLSCVGIDDEACGAKAFTHLHENGHTHIGVIGGDRVRSFISQQRYSGFYNASVKANKPHADNYYQASSFSMESGYKAAKKLLQRENKITALFCMSDLVAVGAMRAVQDMGYKVPQDISIMGFDGIALAKFSTPRLATICQPQQEIAEKSVTLLLAQIEKNKPVENVLLPFTFLQGESVQSL